MAGTFLFIPPAGGGSDYWQDAVADFASLPAGVVVGEVRMTIDTFNVYYWDGASWILFVNPTADVSGPSSSVNNEIVLFNGTSGKVIKAATGTGVVHATSGVYSVANVNLTSEVTGVLPIANGGTNSSTALSNNRVIQSSAGAIVEAAAITAARALISDANGIPTHSVVTATELAFLSGITGNVVQGAVSSTDNAIVRWDGATGRIIQNSLVTISDNGQVWATPDILAIGNGATASGISALAVGTAASATGTQCTALGYLCSATSFSVAIGAGCTANGGGGGAAFALGYLCTATGANSNGIGYFSQASGSESSAFGFTCIASGNPSVSMGHRCYTDVTPSAAFGLRALSQNANKIGIACINGTSQGTKIVIQGGSTALIGGIWANDMVDLDASWIDPTNATRTSRLDIRAYYASSALAGFRLDAASDQARSAIGGSIISAVKHSIINSVNADKVLVLRGSSAQSGNFLEFQSSGSGVFSAFTSNGSLIVGSSAVSNSSVGIEINSSEKALLVSRMEESERDALTPIDGMIIYNTDVGKFQGYENGAWISFTGWGS